MERIGEYLKVIDENMISFLFLLIIMSTIVVGLIELGKWIWNKIRRKKK